MMSTITAIFPSDPTFDNPLSTFGSGFTSSWDSSELFSSIHSPEPLISRTDSAEPNEPNRNSVNTNSGSDEPSPKRSGPVVDERKRRRMISNRESARRSRMRKQKHTENLQNQVNRLRTENRDLSNRLRMVLLHLDRVRTDNDRLRSERVVFGQKMSYMNQVSVSEQFQQFEQQQQQQQQQQFLPPVWLNNDLMVEPSVQTLQINFNQINK